MFHECKIFTNFFTHGHKYEDQCEIDSTNDIIDLKKSLIFIIFCNSAGIYVQWVHVHDCFSSPPTF